MRRWVLAIKILSLILALWLGKVSNVTCLLQGTYTPMDRARLHGSGEVIFVPLAGFPEATVHDLAGYYHERYGLRVALGRAPVLPAAAFDVDRGQLVAQEVVEVIKQALRPANDATVIAFTAEDMYIRGYSWRYAFSYRHRPLAVVSSARMAERVFSVWPASPERQQSRLRKMTTKNIGVLHYRLPLSTHCRSVMYGDIGGPHELDFMGEDF